MTFGAQEAKKNALCDKQRKSIKYSIYDSRFFLKANYEYDHNSIRIDTEQDSFLFYVERFENALSQWENSISDEICHDFYFESKT